MKTLKAMMIVPLLAIFILNAAAKSQTIGLYLTAQDYLSHKLSYNAGVDKIKVTGLFGSNSIVLTHDGKKQIFAKSEIFGYSEDGQDFRFFNNAEYRIVSSKGLLIYTHSTLVQQGKGPKPTELYYFSASLSDAVLPLTITNILSVYAKHPEFTYSVESFFKSDAELSAYDSYNKQFKLAYLCTHNMSN
jgi:hypothetical protein